ncbi:MAG: ATP-binding protein [Ginsengibacter sp.]
MQQKEEIIFAIIVIVIVLVFLGILFLVMLGRHNLRKNFLLHENDRIKKEFEKTLLDTQLEIQEQTLNHVSREIHDNIGQILSLVRLQMNSMSSSPTEEEIANTDELLGKAIVDLRALSHSLNTNNIHENGFVESIKQVLSQFEKTGKFTTQFIVKDDDFIIPDDHGIILFRIVQEVLNNIVKHAEATTISISIEKNDGHSEIKIIDNGKGFDTGIIDRNGGGIGLKNMTDRAKVIGAKLSVNSQTQTGTTVTITL